MGPVDLLIARAALAIWRQTSAFPPGLVPEMAQILRRFRTRTGSVSTYGEARPPTPTCQDQSPQANQRHRRGFGNRLAFNA
jgi:hypothetical protein